MAVPTLVMMVATAPATAPRAEKAPPIAISASPPARIAADTLSTVIISAWFCLSHAETLTVMRVIQVASSDSTGRKATVTDPAAVTTAAWTEVKVPLSAFTGVNMAKVKKLIVGVGNPANPAADGTGRIFIDDIRVTKP